MMLPRAILFDLDDTLISAYGRPEAAWLAVTAEFAEALAPLATAGIRHPGRSAARRNAKAPPPV